MPPGLKLAFTEILGDRVNIWAASVAQPDARRILATLDRPNDLGLNISLSPEGHRIAYTVVPDHFKPNGLLAELRLLDLRTGQERTLATNIDLGGYENYPLWSPDGVYLAYRRQSATGTPYTQSLTLLHVNSGQEQTVATGDDSTWLWFKAWSPDSHDVYFSRGIANAELWRLDVTQPGHAAELVNQMWNGPLPPRCRALSPDGQWLVCTVLSSQDRLKYAVILVPTSSTGETVTVFESLEGNYSPIWYPNGREVLINEKQGEGGSLVAIDINSRVARTIATRRQEFFIPQGFSPDGEWITTQIFPDSEGSLLMIRSDGTQEQPVTAQGLVNLLGWITNESANLH